MVDYEKLYHLMVDAAELALEALENEDPQRARQILITAEQEAEERYISSAE